MRIKILISILIIAAAGAGVFVWQRNTGPQNPVTPPDNANDFINQTLAGERDALIPTTTREQTGEIENPKNKEDDTTADEPVVLGEICTGNKQSDFDCYKSYYEELLLNGSVKAAFADLRQRYETNNYIKSQCHPMVHVLGNAAAKKFSDVGEACANGDNFCSSGYHHGVLEGMIAKIGYANLAQNLDKICTGVAAQNRYSLTHHNCTHGLGHGLMAITNTELFESVKLCDELDDTWEQSSCYGGVFMENIIFDGKYHSSKYLKPADALYPCNAVEHKYAGGCYLIQTAYMLKVAGGDFKKVFELCSQAADTGLQSICYQSLGRDASGWNIANIASIKNICMMGKDYEQQSGCIIGAAKDVVWYRYSDVEGKQLCASLDSSLQQICYSTVDSYYQTFK